MPKATMPKATKPTKNTRATKSTQTSKNNFFAIFSDIHGNIDALEAILADMAGFPVRGVFCLGDIVGYGPEPGDATAHWYQFPGAVISGNTITLTITDGLQGDDDLLHSGVIADPGGPGEFAGTTDVPTLSEWGLILLSLLLALLGVVQVSRLGPRAR